MSATAITRVLVVVPARDEAATLGACLESIAAARALAERMPDVETRLVVVADACVDDSAAIARAAGAAVVEIDAASVGAARRAGIEHGLAEWKEAGELDRAWVAMTDADSTVPRSWLLDQLQAAYRGADLHVGRVEPDAAVLPPAALAAWHAAHDPLPAGAAVHGANLGVRATVLERIGGVAPMRLHEDVDLVARLHAAGAVVDDRRRPPVRTSGRTRSRVEGGFASYLSALQEHSPQLE
ncbi:glycosyltransferase family A protein [Agrococcus sp. ProA11]|uniref:glycosyltransferase n=1 Tax=Agrococcus chionoecetis TaxID=3153752 RepID=UPI0032616BE6